MDLQDAAFDDVLSTPGHLIALAARGFARLAEARLRPYGFAVGQLPVLVALKQEVADTQGELARFAGTRQPPMAQMLARMARDGLVESQADLQDGRVTRLALTEQARERMPEAIAILFAGNREAMTGFSEAEVALFLDMLRRLIANLNAIEASPSNQGSTHKQPSLPPKADRPV